MTNDVSHGDEASDGQSMGADPEPTASIDAALAHATRLLATHPDMAAEQAREIIRAVGDHPIAWLVLAASHRLRDEPAQALAILEPLARSQPNAARVHLELGLALGQARRGGEAIASLRRAVALKPDLPQAWLALGDHLAAVGDASGADVAYANHVRHSTRDPDLMRAASALAGERLPEAELLLRTHLKKSPTDVVAIRMLAEVAARIGRIEDAETLLERCIEIAPAFHAARMHYAQVLHRSNKPERALEEVEKLLAVDRRNPGYRNLKAVVLSRIGEYAGAIDLYAAIVAEYPDQPSLWLSYGHVLRAQGDIARSIEAYRRCIALKPEFGDAWWSLANLKTYRFDTDDIAAMRRALAVEALESEHRLHLEFALGKAMEDASDYGRAFAHYESGNAIRLAAQPYEPDDNTLRVRRAKSVYTREFFAARSGYGSDASDPIFIVGLPRSGSTLVEQILSSHPLVEGTMELPEIISITRRLRKGDPTQRRPSQGGSYHEILAGMDAAEIRELGERYIGQTRIQRKAGTPFFVDKMPNNFAHVGLIQLMLPNARIIDARRHPLACCFSNFKQQFARGQGFSYDLDHIGRYYRDYVELMAHFDAVLPGRIHRVTYENMVEDTEAEVRRLLDYCGLSFDESCLRFFENERPVRTASSEQVRRPIYREGVDYWVHFEPWLDPLKRALGPVLDSYPEAPASGDEGKGTGMEQEPPA